MPDSKWIPGLTADTPVGVAARQALDLRIQAIHRLHPLAVRHAQEDIEYVHQLRVATRRCRAAVDLFGEFIPKKARKRLCKRLRELRKSAGDARDWDVFLSSLAEPIKQATTQQAPGLHWLAGQASALRSKAQGCLEQSGDQPLEDLDDAVRAAKKALKRSKAREPLIELARRRLPELLEKLEQSAAQDDGDYDRLHEARIHGKRLRYAMEILAGCFPAGFKKSLYKRVEELQEILGQANDSYVAELHLAAMKEMAIQQWPILWRQWRPGVEGWLRRHRGQLARSRGEFFRFWKRWRQLDTHGEFMKLL